MGALSTSCSELWMASASIRIICQLTSLKVRIYSRTHTESEYTPTPTTLHLYASYTCVYLSTSRVLNACVAQVAGHPAGVNAVDLQLRKLE